MRRLLSLFGAVVLVPAIWIACASQPLQPPVRVMEPIPLGPNGSQSIAFLHVVERIPAGTLLGVVRWKSGSVIDEIRARGESVRSKAYNVAITDLLRGNGYTVRDEADAVFDAGREVRVRYQLAGVIHDMDVDYVYKRSHKYGVAPVAVATASTKFELQVYDPVLKRTVFERTYEGLGSDRGTKPQPVVLAVVDAVRGALADPDFVAAVAQGAGPLKTVEGESSPFTVVKRCGTKPAAPTPNMDETLESVVVVRVGGTWGGGVLISEEGHVITAAHVVGEGDDIFVDLRSGPMIPARVMSRNASRDLALLKLPGHGYPCAALMRAGTLPIGSEIFTINIFVDEKMPTVARGIVSGYQEIEGRRYIQTDASVNPGSSGGPLFDQTGRVGGIVTDKVFGFGIEGIGLGVPIGELDRSLHINWE